MGDTKSVLTWLLRDEVSGPAKKINDTLDKTGKAAGGAGGLFGKLGEMTGGFVTPANLAIGAAAGLATFLVGAGKAAADEEKNVQRMSAALVAAVPGFDGNTDAIEALISKREDLAFSDDELRESFATLVTSTHDVKQASDLQATAMDLARLKGVSLAAASDALAKANIGSTKELKALGITVDDTKDKTEVFAAIQKAAAGQAEAYAGTAAGKWETFQNKLGDVVETIGGAVLPIMDALVSFAADDLIPALQGLADLVGPILGAAFGALGTAVKIVGDGIGFFIDHVVKPAIDAINWLTGDTDDSADAMRNQAGAARTAIKDLDDNTAAQKRNAGALDKVADAYSTAAGQSIAYYEWLAKNAGMEYGADALLTASRTKSVTTRASGGMLGEGWNLVGEEGPELISPSREVFSANRTAGMMGGGVPVSIPIYLDGREIARVVDEHLYYRGQVASPGRIRS